MNNNFSRALMLCFLIFTGACGTSPIKATHLSDQKNIWIEEAETGLFYCVSSPANSKEVDPVCFPARRRTAKDTASIPLTPPDTPPLESKNSPESDTKETKESPKEASKSAKEAK